MHDLKRRLNRLEDRALADELTAFRVEDFIAMERAFEAGAQSYRLGGEVLTRAWWEQFNAEVEESLRVWHLEKARKAAQSEAARADYFATCGPDYATASAYHRNAAQRCQAEADRQQGQAVA